MWRQMIPGFRMTLLFTVLTGLLYPGLVTALCQTLFPKQANGSLVMWNGRAAGSELIGQAFTRPEYFHPRPSAAGADGYDASLSGGSNLGPTSQKLVTRVASARKAETASSPVPADLLTTSASGLDPHVSPASARWQSARVARARGVAEPEIERVISQFTEGRDLGFLGEPRVNVLRVNLALDERFPVKR